MPEIGVGRADASGLHAAIPCDCGPPMTLDPVTDRYRCARRRCGRRIDLEAIHRFLTLLYR